MALNPPDVAVTVTTPPDVPVVTANPLELTVTTPVGFVEYDT